MDHSLVQIKFILLRSIKGPVFQVAVKCKAVFASINISENRIYLGFPRNQVFALQTSVHLNSWLCKYI